MVPKLNWFKRSVEAQERSVRFRPGPLLYVGVAEWQTHQLEELAPITGCAGSTPVIDTKPR